MRLRLALCYGALTAGVVVLACTYGYAVHSRTHYEQLDGSMQAAAVHIAAELALASTPGARDTVISAATSLGVVIRLIDAPPGFVGQYRDAGAPSIDPGWLRRATPGPAYPPLATLAPVVHTHADVGGRFTVFAPPSGARWRVFHLPATPSRPGIAAVAPLEGLDASVTTFGHVMVLSGLVGTFVTLVMAWWMAARLLRPVVSLTETAEEIARTRAFDRRVALPGAGGNAHHAQHAQHDELARLSSTFNRMLASLEQAYAGQQRFVADASHEIRAPLTAIIGNLELLTRSVPDAERAVALIEARREADRLARLVADLLTLARADARARVIRTDYVAMADVVSDALRDARHLLRGQVLSVDAIDHVVVTGDRDRMLQLLLILVDNAAKYTPAGGQLHIALRRVADGGRTAAALSVRDSGVGIAPEDLPYVFDRFFRSDRARAREPGGSGLGLGIAQWIVEQHRGTITVDSTLGVGTTVRILLPAVE